MTFSESSLEASSVAFLFGARFVQLIMTSLIKIVKINVAHQYSLEELWLSIS